MYRKLQKTGKMVAVFMMAAILGVGMPVQNIPVYAQAGEEPEAAGMAAESEEPISADIAAQSAQPQNMTEPGTASQGAEPGFTPTESIASAKESLNGDDIRQSEDGMWYYIDRSLVDGGVGIVIMGRGHIGEEKEKGIVSTYIEDAAEKLCYTIPGQIDGENVTAIGNIDHTSWGNLTRDAAHCAFIGLADYDLVVVPEGVDTIYSYCFYESAFKRVKLPETLESIGTNAFGYDENLTQINIPETVESIGGDAFCGTPWLDERIDESDRKIAIVNHILIRCGRGNEGDVVVPEGVKKIAPAAFSFVPITSVTIPGSVEEIGDECFVYDNRLTSITIEEGVEKIGARAFCMTGIEELSLPPSVREIGSQICSGSGQLKSVKLGKNITALSESAFYGCKSLQTISLSEGLQSIGSACFSGCESLQELTLPEHVTEIGKNAFYGCGRISKLTLPEDLMKLGENAFRTQGGSEEPKIILTVPEKRTDIFGLNLENHSYARIRVVEGGTAEAYLRKKNLYPYQTYKTGCEKIEAGTQTVAAPPETDDDDTQDDPSGSDTSGTGQGTENGDGTPPVDEEEISDVTPPADGEETSDVTPPADGEKTGDVTPPKDGEEASDVTPPADGEKTGDVTSPADGEKTGDVTPPKDGEKTGDVTSPKDGEENSDGTTHTDGAETHDGTITADGKETNDGTTSAGETQTRENPAGGDGTETIETLTGNDNTGAGKEPTGSDGMEAREKTEGESGTGDAAITNIDQSVTNIDQSTKNIDQSTKTIDQSTTTIIYQPPEEKSAAEEKQPVSESLAGKVFTYKKCKYQIGADEKTVTFVCADNKDLKTLTIPGKAVYQKEKYKVVNIAQNACKGMKKLQTVTIGACVEEIGQKAFCNCAKLKTVTIGKHVEEIGKMAFYGDSALKKLTFKNMKALKSVDAAAFYLKGSKTDKRLKKKSTSKKLLLAYLKNSGVKVTAK